MLKIGEINTLKILRGTSVGFYLGDDEGNDVLLPHKYIPENTEVGQDIDVYIYRDSEDRAIATTLKPLINLNEFACLEVKDDTNFGAFIDIGLEKDLLVPFRQQMKKLKKGEWTIIYLYLDTQTDRLVGSCKVNKYLQTENIDLSEGQEVDLLVYEKSDLGFNVIVDNKYRGLLYENEIFQRISWGDKVKGYVKKIREDGKLDIILQKNGLAQIEPAGLKILIELKSNEGFLPISDASDPMQIQEILEMSKKTFKKAIGGLYKQKLITIEDGGIRIV